MSLSIHIPQFEGPLGLLLFLIRKEEMDIFDIDVHLITSQYLEYIKKMKEFDLEVAGDFIAMAATLIQIKSKKHFLWLVEFKRTQAQTRVDGNQNLPSCFFESGIRGLVMLRQAKESKNPDLQRNDKSQRIPQT